MKNIFHFGRSHFSESVWRGQLPRPLKNMLSLDLILSIVLFAYFCLHKIFIPKEEIDLSQTYTDGPTLMSWKIWYEGAGWLQLIGFVVILFFLRSRNPEEASGSNLYFSVKVFSAQALVVALIGLMTDSKPFSVVLLALIWNIFALIVWGLYELERRHGGTPVQ